MPIIGPNDLKDISWLKQCLKLTRSVACILRQDAAPATGFLIAPDLLMTNWHVLWDRDIASKSKAIFNQEKDWSGNSESPMEYEFDPIPLINFTSDNILDYAIVRVRDKPGERFGWVDLGLRCRRKPHKNTPLIIIQHPAGGPKQIALYQNRAKNPKKDNDKNKIYYTGDTDSGSSGSPVFDHNCNIVALHSGGGSRTRAGTYNTNVGQFINSIVEKERKFLGLPDD